jgi:hypothetical protein
MKDLLDFEISGLIYIIETLPESPNDMVIDVGDHDKLGCRILPYILNITATSFDLSNRFRWPVDKAEFRSRMGLIFGKFMTFDVPEFVVSKTFTTQSFPIVCDLMNFIFTQDESIAFVLRFLETF